MNGLCRVQPRILFGLAGAVTLTSAVLAVALSPWFLLVAGFTAVNQLLYAAAGACPASLVLRRACRSREVAR